MENALNFDFNTSNINKYKGNTIVIKFGGSIMRSEEGKDAFFKDVAYLKKNGVNIVIVHGGGPNISNMLDKIGCTTEFINGQRVTDGHTMEIVEMTLCGSVNKELSGTLSSYSLNALGVSGRDCSLLKAKKKYSYVNGEKIDLGLVGEVESVNTEFLNMLIDKDIIPVIAPIGVDNEGNIYNINADYVAGAVSSALKAEKLVLMTDIEGVYLDINDKSSLIKEITTSEIKDYIKSGVIQGGMIPKMECCIAAIENGTNTVHLVDGRREHSLLTDAFGEGYTSTSIKGGN
ncbi:acetylglutamate kinase [Clostridium cylindrosporum]|uniref:Acetylglutamate kinase n=1 Tax=Clostridium cylindrosporum DSM 605 TaxID=1121307 RepID=A0A0J8D9Y8_CLOCY|nr:acetylglutamate kinase [Clostridium cylindrosporum]KMT22657.1 acetylglutamate kinase ArgB [Clostridium cylindrosporum DSM 605]